ncbi:hypothetical protein PRIPAC_80157 [Pristionchus pacificus]|uniref:Uncharacterized protein n=1 Tax=Pristionchus pacificus TaxID=54126 RepID=A0A2A6CN24_PRIPA|nr:hypothetical protein PRIPAC_80157 [Pristionchus pacificus]|eukprot:PDM79602.1 hypothetical protein PRIPAC_32181 [Pristionchus pacificus]
MYSANELTGQDELKLENYAIRLGELMTRADSLEAVVAPGSRWHFNKHARKVPVILLVIILLVVPQQLYAIYQILSTDWPPSLLARADCLDTDHFEKLSAGDNIAHICYIEAALEN